MRISDWSSDVCSSDLLRDCPGIPHAQAPFMNAGQLRKQAEDVLDVVDGGGVAIIPLDVAYAILARTEAGIRKIFEVKRRGYDKPSDMFACLAHSTDLHLLGSREREIQRVLIEEYDLPFSVEIGRGHV